MEELLCIVLDGIQNKKESIDSFCAKYQVMTNKDQIEEEFLNIIKDISEIFTLNEELYIRKTRFKQRSDFYSVFSVICDFHKKGKQLQRDKLAKLRDELAYLDDNIEPHSEIAEFSNYAIHCTSDANSISSRQWRKNFLEKYFEGAYV